MGKAILAIAIGSALGGLLRWLLGLRLNAVFASMPLGTLSANLIAGYVVGVAVAAFAQSPHLSPEWRLLIITGFCGGLSTFSTFSAEVIDLLQRGQWAWAGSTIAVHVAGSLAMTALGMGTWHWLRS
jgi:CrcB protein